MKKKDDWNYFSFPKYVTPPGSPKGHIMPMMEGMAEREELPIFPPRMSPFNIEQTYLQGPISMLPIPRYRPYCEMQTTHLPYHPPIQINPSFSEMSNTTVSNHLPEKSLILLPQHLSTSNHLSLPHPSTKYRFSMRTPVPSHKEAPIIQESIPQSDNLPYHSASASGPSCTICGDRAGQHLHYGAVACFSCRQFFRRGWPKGDRCVNDTGCCNINKFNRTNCKLCR